MPTVPHEVKAFFEEALVLEPEAAHMRWTEWRSQIETDDFDGHVVTYLPLLNDRLTRWNAEGATSDLHQVKLIGMCKRAWAQNQMRFNELADHWRMFVEGEITPLAFGGEPAWALMYQREQSVRPFASFEFLVERGQAETARRLLESSGWLLPPHTPQLTGRLLDLQQDIWFSNGYERTLRLVWRVRNVAPALAVENEGIPGRVPHDLRGIAAFTLAPEELLFDALARPVDILITWRCDAIVLLRNHEVDWQRMQVLLDGQTVAKQRLQELNEMYAAGVPWGVFDGSRHNTLYRRLHAIWVSSQHIAWKEQRPHTRGSFLRYALWRLGHGLVYHFDVHNASSVIDATSKRKGSSFAEYMRYRAFFVFLTMRDVRLRYTRTWRGILWALVQPLLPMLIFAGIFARVIRPELHQIPYWLFVLTGIAIWSFFANAVNYASMTFVANLNLVNKAYFPRAILPIAAVTACVVDLLIAVGVLLPICYFMGFHPGVRLLALPVVLLAATLLGAIVGTAAASLNVLHRDFKPLVPFLVQIGMYATPVLYPVAMVPHGWRMVAWINPMTAVIEALRSIIFKQPLNWQGVGISCFAAILLVFLALRLFHGVEADIAERL
jgi:lipopolysaccharide transport system permease protein